jgi:hypothetical protein
MVKLGYKLMAEEHVPAALVRNTVRAEQAGFAFAAISDDSSGDRAVALAAAAHTLIRFERR